MVEDSDEVLLIALQLLLPGVPEEGRRYTGYR